MVRVLWLGAEDIPPRGYWDQTIIEDLIAGRLWRPSWIGPVTHHERRDSIDAGGSVLVIMPGPYHAPRVTEINEILAKFERVVLFITSDEEAKFPWRELRHPNLRLWVQYARPGVHDDTVRMLPVGWSPETRAVRDAHDGAKDLLWFFSGQVTHARRVQCVEQLRSRKGGVLIETKAFLQGAPPKEYLETMARAKIALCPGGAASPDTFRVFEALELGAVPLVDRHCGMGEVGGYWERLFFGGPPFPLIDSWEETERIFGRILADWPAYANRVGSWWIGYKRRLAQEFKRDVDWLEPVRPDPPRPASKLSVLMPTSPIKSHPDTSIIENTIASITSRADLDGVVEILVMCDGVRKKQEDYRGRYEVYQSNLIRLALRRGDVWPIRFEAHTHQAGMTQKTLEFVDSAAILFVEHDTPFVNDWSMIDKLVECVLSEADLVRLHHEVSVLEPHEHLMLDKESHEVCGLPLRRTIQWSQRPHVASTAFYRRILKADFDLPREKWMIEDKMYSKVVTAWREFGLAGWERYKLYMYVPEGNIQRSVHTDGRQGDHKWVDE